ncbi:VOC family protein [Roseinatronobacter alkalisoli]|uniref:VOC family protein n=1 Tax=Roseinatronobacter alkalisoli TaxID=3028235 RepID=A0ABT5TEN8_9RHOB|nr:VOC family protein [Roseinatronobacter sp. HJB301]MDD7973568.1 VOC family protein [Roseinatronobacter sp. HJB301]
MKKQSMPGIGYTMVGTTDLSRALAFYDPLFAAMGLDQCWRDDSSASWGKAEDESFPRFFTGYPFDGGKAGVGNGAMTAFLCAPDLVDQLHALALRNGGTSEGTPGRRPQYGDGFYGAYVRDPDGNKLAFVCYDAPSTR